MNSQLAFSVETIRKLCALFHSSYYFESNREAFLLFAQYGVFSLTQNGFRNPACLMGIIIVFFFFKG